MPAVILTQPTVKTTAKVIAIEIVDARKAPAIMANAGEIIMS